MCKGINVLILLLCTQNGTYFNPSPAAIAVQLIGVSSCSDTIMISRSEVNGVYEGTDLVVSMNLGTLPRGNWHLGFILEYSLFSINSSTTNFSKL